MSGGLNFDALKQVQNELQTGDGVFLYQNKLTDAGTDVRLMPPAASLNGVFYLKRVVWQIGKKIMVSPMTFGEECPIEAELELAKEWAAQQNDGQLKALIAKLDDPYPAMREEFLVPILLLDVKYNTDWSVQSMKVVGDKPKYLICSKMLLGSIVDKVTSRHYYNGTKDGITDREKGWNLTLKKTVKSNKTEYSCEGWREATEMSEKYYREIPDPVTFTKKGMYSDDYMTSVIRNYLYGEPEIAEEARYPELKDAATTEANDAPVATEKAAPARTAAPPKSAPKAAAPAKAKQAAAPKAATAKQPEPEVEEQQVQEEEQPQGMKESAAPPRRNVLDDLSQL